MARRLPDEGRNDAGPNPERDANHASLTKTHRGPQMN